MNIIKTSHNLDFEVAQPTGIVLIPHQLFRVGTCLGQWTNEKDCYAIISVANSDPGNGHLDDVFEWFEHSAKRDNINLLVLCCLNVDFYFHLINKRGFMELDKERENCIKVFNQKLYKRLLKNGNGLLDKNLRLRK